MTAPTREQLEAAVSLADRVRVERDQILESRDHAGEAAALAASIEHQYFLRAQRRLEEYDEASEQLMAENAGRVSSLAARLSHIRSGQASNPGEDAVASIERELRQHEHERDSLVPLRIRRRGPVVHRLRIAAHRAAMAGERAWRLNQVRLADLEQVIEAGRNARRILDTFTDAPAADLGGASVHRESVPA